MKKAQLILFFLFAGFVSYAQNRISPPVIQVYGNDTILEYPPEFPGGDVAFNKYLRDSTRYPLAEKKAGKQGDVSVSWIVEEDGSISHVQVTKEIEGAPGLTKEALRVIQTMPKWLPPTLNGHYIPVTITQTIHFVLTTDNESENVKKKRRGR